MAIQSGLKTAHRQSAPETALESLQILQNFDHTLWQLHVDKLMFPFQIANKKVVDSKGVECSLYPDVLEILSWLKLKNVPMAIASRVSDLAGAYLLLHLFTIRNFFWPVEIYPTSKTLHFEQIQKKTGVAYEDMIFFDDDKRNLRDLMMRFDVPCVHVPKGLKIEHLQAFDDDSWLYKRQ